MKEKNISIAFLGALVPDTVEYRNVALRRSGNLVQDGVTCGLKDAGAEVEIFSVQPRASYPKDRKLYYKGTCIRYKGMPMHLVGFLNIVVLKTIWISIAEMLQIFKWALIKRHQNRVIMVYNTYTPPLPLVWLMGKLTRSKTFPILYDLGIPPKELNLGRLRMTIYGIVEFFSKVFIPMTDGRIVINEAIGEDYAHGKDYIIVDGGLSDDVLEKIETVKRAQEKRENCVTLFLGGLLSPINGSRLIGELLEKNKRSDFKIIVAGDGHDRKYIEQLAVRFPDRIVFLGMLSLDELFKVYNRCDVLMNLRILSPQDRYLFPSKVIEYMATGIPVITTNAGHIKEKYGKYCFVLNDHSVESLSDVIDKVISMPWLDLNAMGLSAKTYMMETHTWRAQSKKIYQYIKDTIC